MTDAREITAEARTADEIRNLNVDWSASDFYGLADWATFEAGILKGLETAADHIASLTATGIRLAGPDDRIIGKDEVDQVTVEKCAEVVEATPISDTLSPKKRIADAIRAIGRKA